MSDDLEDKVKECDLSNGKRHSGELSNERHDFRYCKLFSPKDIPNISDARDKCMYVGSEMLVNKGHNWCTSLYDTVYLCYFDKYNPLISSVFKWKHKERKK